MEPIGQFLTASYRYFGITGSLLVSLAVIYCGLGYRGRRKERYSIFNHFISELGEWGVARRAWAFNAAMIGGGVLLVPFMLGLGLRLGGVWGILGLLAGLWAAVSCALVGVFPMNNLGPHSVAATSYFRAGLVMAVLFGVAILAQVGQPAIPRHASLFSLLAVAAYASFLVLLQVRPAGDEIKTNLDPAVVAERPAFWLLPALEWAVFFSTILWIFGIALLG